jgi:hypothetical protein
MATGFRYLVHVQLQQAIVSEIAVESDDSNGWFGQVECDVLI